MVLRQSSKKRPTPVRFVFRLSSCSQAQLLRGTCRPSFVGSRCALEFRCFLAPQPDERDNSTYFWLDLLRGLPEALSPRFPRETWPPDRLNYRLQPPLRSSPGRVFLLVQWQHSKHRNLQRFRGPLPPNDGNRRLWQ